MPPTRDGARLARKVNVLLLLCLAEGLGAILQSLQAPSMARRAVLGGYSAARIASLLPFLVLLLMLAGILVLSLLNRGWFLRVLSGADLAMRSGTGNAVNFVYACVYASILGVYLLFLVWGPGDSSKAQLVSAALDKLALPLTWIAVLPPQLLLFLGVAYWGATSPIISGVRDSRRSLLLIVALAASMHWVTLVVRAGWLQEVPGWFWHFKLPKEPRFSFLAIALTGIAACAAAWQVLRSPNRTLRNLVLCIAVGYALQVGYGFASGKGFESLREKYVNTPLSDQLWVACESPRSLAKANREYESTYAQWKWYKTKPPGLVSFYLVARGLIGRVVPGVLEDPARCLEVVSRIGAYAFPLLAALVVLPLFAVEGLISRGSERYVSSLLWISVPSVLLMPVLPDQFLYPLLASVTVMVIGFAVLRGSGWLALLAGALVYTGAYFSFSLLPLLGLALAWPLVRFFAGRGAVKPSDTGRVLVGLAAGIALAWMIGLVLLGYDPVARYANAFLFHRQVKNVQLSAGSLLDDLVLNNLEFALWSGAALYVLGILGCIVALRQVVVRRMDEKHVLALAFAVAYLVLNLGGQTRGEVGRLWIFLLPVVAIVASRPAMRVLPNPNRSAILVLGLQLVTAGAAFIYLDFR